MTCRTCKYSHQITTDRDPYEETAECRRHAPIASENNAAPIYPVVRVHAHWCGDYEYRGY